MVNKGRIEWVDLLKGIAILELIVYHFHVFEWMRSPVPFFFFLSGLFFYKGKSFGSFVKKKANALLVPLFFFFVLGVAASALKCMLQGETYSFPPLWLFATLIPADAEVTNPMGVGAIWFLVSLFEIYIIYYGLRIISKNSWWVLVAGIFFYIISFVTSLYYASGSLFYLFYTFGFCIFFFIAHLLRDKVLYGKIPMWLVLIAILMYLVRFVDTGNVLIADNLCVGGILLRFQGLISMMGLIVLLVWLCKLLSSIKIISESKIYGFILFEGRNSLTILGIHMLIMGVAGILLKKFISVDGLYYLFLFILIVIVSNICILLFNKYIPYLVNHTAKP